MGNKLNLRKLTGCAEHWVTTFHRGYWALPSDKREEWKTIDIGDEFVFHASKPKMNDPENILSSKKQGIIGTGVVEKTRERKDDERRWWREEQQKDADGIIYPYLIKFKESKTSWFGRTYRIDDRPVKKKDTIELLRDTRSLMNDAITFSEMEESKGYSISRNGSIENINEPEKIRPLIRKRLED